MKFKVGDRIPVSAIVEITGISITKNDKAVYSTDHGFAVCENVLEQISIKGREKPVMPEPTPKINWREPEPKPTPAPEPFKLYCVKDYKPGEWCTKGKIYEMDAKGLITFDDGWRDDISCFEDTLIPLVHRPAKVGECVLIQENATGTAEDYINKIVLVSMANPSGFCRSIKAPGYMFPIESDEYLVLYNYTGD